MLYPGVSCSDVAVELPFTLMHPKPREEPVHRDSECPALGERARIPGGGWGQRGPVRLWGGRFLVSIDPVHRASVLKPWRCPHHPNAAKLRGGCIHTLEQW